MLINPGFECEIEMKSKLAEIFRLKLNTVTVYTNRIICCERTILCFVLTNFLLSEVSMLERLSSQNVLRKFQHDMLNSNSRFISTAKFGTLSSDGAA